MIPDPTPAWHTAHPGSLPGHAGAAPRRRLMLLIAALHAALGWALLDAGPLHHALSVPPALTVTLLPTRAADAPTPPADPLPQPPLRAPSTTWLPVPEVVVADAPPRPVAPPPPPGFDPVAPAQAMQGTTAVAAALHPAVAVPPPAAQPVAQIASTEIPSSEIRYRVLPDIVYPAVSRRLGEAGLVIVAVLVDADGLPRELQLVQSSGFERLDRAALAGVRRARFEPYLRHGRPSAGWVRIPIPFELER